MKLRPGTAQPNGTRNHGIFAVSQGMSGYTVEKSGLLFAACLGIDSQTLTSR
jgi:hypothetical protein